MASKTSSRTPSTARKPRSFDVLLPRLNRADAGVTFEAGNYMRRSGVVPAQLQAVRMNGSPLGVHAASKDGSTSLCRLPITANGKSLASGTANKVAASVTCKFCQTRLVAAGLLDPQAEGVSAYAADYGSRDAESELAAIEARASNGKARTTSKAKAAA